MKQRTFIHGILSLVLVSLAWGANAQQVTQSSTYFPCPMGGLGGSPYKSNDQRGCTPLAKVCRLGLDGDTRQGWGEIDFDSHGVWCGSRKVVGRVGALHGHFQWHAF